MKKYSKGTSLVEIIISLSLISIVVLFMFNILTDLKAEDRESTTDSQDTVERTSYTRIIQNDFIQKELVKVTTCSAANSLYCYSFEYKTGNVKVKRLEIYSNYIVYDDEKWSLDSTTFNSDRASICYGNKGSNYYFKMNIPTNSNAYSSRKLDLELTYESDYINISIPKKNCN